MTSFKFNLFKGLIGLKRPHGSETEAITAALLAKRFKATMIDGAGNLHFDLRDGRSSSLFTAHIDTVHRQGGANDYTQDAEWFRAKGDALGADDAAGIAIITHMITNKVPGYYILFRGEEQGGIGSKWLANNMRNLLGNFSRAIAFDRAGFDDVITNQYNQDCCSDEFADKLSTMLMEASSTLLYSPCEYGVYTDTAEFIGLIPNCTNISVGYFEEHGARECQSKAHLLALAEAVLKVKWETLPMSGPVKRKQNFTKSHAWYLRLINACYDALDCGDYEDLVNLMEAEVKVKVEEPSLQVLERAIRGKNYGEVMQILIGNLDKEKASEQEASTH